MRSIGKHRPGASFMLVVAVLLVAFAVALMLNSRRLHDEELSVAEQQMAEEPKAPAVTPGLLEHIPAASGITGYPCSETGVVAFCFKRRDALFLFALPGRDESAFRSLLMRMGLVVGRHDLRCHARFSKDRQRGIVSCHAVALRSSDVLRILLIIFRGGRHPRAPETYLEVDDEGKGYRSIPKEIRRRALADP